MSGLPTAHGGCMCECHVMAGVKHVAACCFPTTRFPPTTEQVRNAYGRMTAHEFQWDPSGFNRWFDGVVEAARAEGAAAEREACAQVAETKYSVERSDYHSRAAAFQVASAIRARSGDGDPLTTHDAEVAARAIEAVADDPIWTGWPRRCSFPLLPSSGLVNGPHNFRPGGV